MDELMANTELTPDVLTKEAIVWADYLELKPGTYQAWMAPEWLLWSMRDASELLRARLTATEKPTIDDDAFSRVEHKWKGIGGSGWASQKRPGVHVVITVAKVAG